MAIDYGDVRIGVAQSDLMQVIASPLEVIPNIGLVESAKQIANLAKNNDVETIVLGLTNKDCRSHFRGLQFFCDITATHRPRSLHPDPTQPTQNTHL